MKQVDEGHRHMMQVMIGMQEAIKRAHANLENSTGKQVSFSDFEEMVRMAMAMYASRSEIVRTAEAKSIIEVTTGRSRAHVVRRLSQALDLGLVEYDAVFDPKDKRSRFIRLTDLGRKLVEQIALSTEALFSSKSAAGENIEQLVPSTTKKELEASCTG